MPVSFRVPISRHRRVKLTESDVRVLEAIAAGHHTRGEQDNFILVDNPDFTLDNGEDPNLVISLRRVFQEDELFPEESE